jgi:hypothetical protein
MCHTSAELLNVGTRSSTNPFPKQAQQNTFIIHGQEFSNKRCIGFFFQTSKANCVQLRGKILVIQPDHINGTRQWPNCLLSKTKLHSANQPHHFALSAPTQHAPYSFHLLRSTSAPPRSFSCNQPRRESPSTRYT